MSTTKEEVRAKVIELLDDTRVMCEKKLDKLLNSGVIDFNSEEPYWGLPKTIMCALAKEINFQYKHTDPPRGWKKKVDNLYLHL